MVAKVGLYITFYLKVTFNLNSLSVILFLETKVYDNMLYKFKVKVLSSVAGITFSTSFSKYPDYFSFKVLFYSVISILFNHDTTSDYS